MEKEQEEIDEVGIDILTYWFGFEYWRKSSSDVENCTAYWDGKKRVFILSYLNFFKTKDLWRGKWFAKEELTAKVDDFIRTNFEEYIQKALRDELLSWENICHGRLALIILLDQFTRNVYRGTKNAWCGDSKALKLCLKGIELKHDLQLKPVVRAMFYMPLLHAEDKELAQLSVNYYSQLYENAVQSKSLTTQILERFKKISETHFRCISIFGRYPESKTKKIKKINLSFLKTRKQISWKKIYSRRRSLS